MCDGRLCEASFTSERAHTPLLNRGDENPQVFQRHIYPLTYIWVILLFPRIDYGIYSN